MKFFKTVIGNVKSISAKPKTSIIREEKSLHGSQKIDKSRGIIILQRRQSKTDHNPDAYILFLYQELPTFWQSET